MWKMILLLGLALTLAVLAGLFVVKRTQLTRRVETMVDEMRSASIPPLEREVRPTDWAGLPAPVQRYFEHVLPAGTSYTGTVTIQQRGTFRDGDRSSAPWSPFTATQHVTIRPPGFVWDATIQMMPGLSVRVLDAYHDGQGHLQARLGGIVPVMDAPPGPKLDEGELLRYLAEAPLYPTALLPGMGVDWTRIDDQSARATLTDRGTTVSLVFSFNERNEVTRVRGTRGFLTNEGTYESRGWTGFWHHYAERNGRRVPMEGEVAWIAPEGKISYWRGHVHHIEHATPDPTAPSTSKKELDSA